MVIGGVVALVVFVAVMAWAGTQLVRRDIAEKSFDPASDYDAGGRLVDDFHLLALPFDSLHTGKTEDRAKFRMEPNRLGGRSWCFTRTSTRGKVWDTTADVLAEVPLEWSYVGVVARRRAAASEQRLRPEPRVELGDTAFDERFEVRAASSDVAFRVLTDEVRQGLLAQPDMLGLEVERGLCWVRLKKSLTEQGLTQLLAFQVTLLERTDPTLWPGGVHRLDGGAGDPPGDPPDRPPDPAVDLG